MSFVTPGAAILVRVLILACCSDVFAASLARADVPPIDACTEPGQPVDAGGTCTCQSSSCTRQIPCSSRGDASPCSAGSGEDPADDDGGSSELCSETYDCTLCLTNRGGVCPTEDGAIGAGARSDAGMQKDENDDGCSCAGSGGGFSGGGIALALWLRTRRRANACS